MTANYPENTSDYDEIFLYRAMKALFTNKNIQNLAKSQSLFDLKQPKRQFLRGKYIHEQSQEQYTEDKIITIAYVHFDFRFIFRTGRLRSY